MNLLLDATRPVSGAPAGGTCASRSTMIMTVTTTGIPPGARTA